MKAFHSLLYLRRIIRIRSLGDLNLDQICRQIMTVYDFFNFIRKFRIVKFYTRYIDRYRNNMFSGLNTWFQHFTGLIPHKTVQNVDQTVFLEKRDKTSRWDHAAKRMNPTHQCFGRYNQSVICTADWLEIYGKLFLHDRCPEIADKALLFDHGI